MRPLVSMSIRVPLAASERLSSALCSLTQEDPTLSFEQEGDSGVTIFGLGELHLEIILDRLLREYGIRVEAGTLQVIYLETIRRSSEVEAKFIRPGPRRQYAHVQFRLEPNPGKGYEFTSPVSADAVPQRFIASVDDGIRESLRGGVLAGYEIVDVKATLYGGSYHEVDSNEVAFKIAGSMAVKEAARRANPVLLEPVMSVQVVVPEEFTGTIIGDLNARRGRIEGMEHRAGSQAIKATVPLRGMFGHAAEMRAHSQGRATFSMQFAGYEEAPLRWDHEDEGGTGVTANTPSKPKPRTGVAAAKPPMDSDL